MLNEQPVGGGAVSDKRQAGKTSHLIGAYLELAKARLCALAVATAAVAFVLVGEGEVDWPRFLIAMTGIVLAAFGANALNQWMEAERDARMQRTAGRPLPAGRLRSGQALGFALATALAGPLILVVFVNPLTAALAVACQLIYVLLYTPLKVRTPLATLVGAVCGAMPPMMGWTAGSGSLEFGAWVLAAILFLWQIPHFLALGWLYRADYARGGFRLLPVLDQSGRFTCRLILLYCLMLIPLALTLTLAGIAGAIYAVGSLALGLSLLAIGLLLFRQRTDANARRLFLASVIYLPLLFGLMVLDPAARAADPAGSAKAAEIRVHRGPSLGGATVRPDPAARTTVRGPAASRVAFVDATVRHQRFARP